MIPALADREAGQYPLAIATSLALEGATGIYPEKETHKNELAEYSELWVNLRTLFRNLYNAVHSDGQGALTAGDLHDAMLEEISALESVVLEHNFSMAIVYYVSNYAGLERKYPKALLKKPKTPKQLIYAEIQRKTIEELLKTLGKEGGRDVRVFDLKLHPKNPTQTYGSALMLTHYAYDLLSYPSFSELRLLESHTGAIKPRSEWYTKYHDGRNLPMIPFREDLMQIFGDSELFSAWNIKDRRPIIELAIAKKWHAMTTVAKIRQDLSGLQNPWLAAQVGSILAPI